MDEITEAEKKIDKEIRGKIKDILAKEQVESANQGITEENIAIKDKMFRDDKAARFVQKAINFTEKRKGDREKLPEDTVLQRLKKEKKHLLSAMKHTDMWIQDANQAITDLRNKPRTDWIRDQITVHINFLKELNQARSVQDSEMLEIENQIYRIENAQSMAQTNKGAPALSYRENYETSKTMSGKNAKPTWVFGGKKKSKKSKKQKKRKTKRRRKSIKRR